ncbi:unnamed protein product [Dicrocoelium dendriticum]|nr:unnamed protein product [Dicrocoelium dendriticum]
MSAEQSERSEDDSETDENAAQGDEHKDEMVEPVVKAGESKVVREPCIPDCSEEAQSETVKNEDAQAVARLQSISEPKETEAKVTNKRNSEIKMMEAGKLDSETSDATSAVLPPSLKNFDSQQRSEETEVKSGWPSTTKEADGDTINSGVPQKDRVQKPLRSSEATHTVTEHFGSAQGRVVSNAVPAMNSQSHDRMGSMTSDFMDLSVQDGVTHEPPQLQFQRRTSQPQSSIYHRSLPVKKTNAPSWYVPPNRPIINPNALPLSDFPDSSVPSAYIDPPFTHPANVASARKRSISTPYIGSHVIAAETGPSLTISLRRPTSERPWGFTFYGGAEYGCPPFVNKVSD